MSLTRDEILQVNDLRRVEVQVPEWSGSVWMRVLTGAERDQFEARVTSKQGLRSWLIATSCVDVNGVQLFTDADAQALGGKSGKAVDRLVLAAIDVNGFGEDEVEKLAGNSDGNPASDSG